MYGLGMCFVACAGMIALCAALIALGCAVRLPALSRPYRHVRMIRALMLCAGVTVILGLSKRYDTLMMVISMVVLEAWSALLRT